ncbi:hypothetical protein F5X68DRAFT_263650 [Plectosphaerella plurivora]|uniref:Rhodopsin domain-containing protein n=1 Tax=Plectosphaerella plurivora TaxID=936078 RepID=A0A9P8V6S5_9PEZI|nr:hypothetical protein F5X68DRAFT_263650 [Plectosphaerella plurivora]
MAALPTTIPMDLPSKLDRSHELVYVQLAFLIAAGLSVIIRIYVKTFLVKHHSLDDYLIYAALVGYTVYGALAMDSAINGATGKHYTLGYSLDEAARSLRGWYLCMALYAPITLTIRASVCVLLLRLARSRVHRWIIYGNFIVIAIISTVFFFVLIFQCSPPSHFWTQVYKTQGTCYKTRIVSTTTTVHSSVCAVSDWCLGLLPIALLWHVKINGRTKAIVAVLLSLGMIAGIALIVRIPYVTRLPPGLEFIYKSIDVAIWSVIEPAVGIIAACVTTFRPLVRHLGFGWNTTGNTYPSGHVQLSNVHTDRFASRRTITRRSRNQSVLESRSSEKGFIHGAAGQLSGTGVPRSATESRRMVGSNLPRSEQTGQLYDS